MSRKRNVFVWSAVQDGRQVAACWQNGRLTCQELREWIEICWTIRGAQNGGDDSPAIVQDWGLYRLALPGGSPTNEISAQHDFVGEELVPEGHFVILGRGPQGNMETVSFAKSEHNILSRAISRGGTSCSPGTSSFRARLKERDGGCCVSGRVPIGYHDWRLYEATHIFPRYAVQIWSQLGFSSEITDTHDSIGVTKIDSVQNGLMLRGELHKLFDLYAIGINPDRNYLIYTFDTSENLNGSQVHFRVAPGHQERPLDSLLRWHFRQCVLRHVKAAGEGDDDEDEDANYDWDDPEAWHLGEPHMYATDVGKRRLEVELAHRLASSLTNAEI